MFLYTTATHEMVFPPPETDIQMMWVQDTGVQTQMHDGKRVVTRLISTDPKKFLDPRYTPGREFS